MLWLDWWQNKRNTQHLKALTGSPNSELRRRRWRKEAGVMAKKTPNLKRLEFCHLLKQFCRPVLCVCALHHGPLDYHNFFSRKQKASFATHWGKSDRARRGEMESKGPFPTKTRPGLKKNLCSTPACFHFLWIPPPDDKWCLVLLTHTHTKSLFLPLFSPPPLVVEFSVLRSHSSLLLFCSVDEVCRAK